MAYLKSNFYLDGDVIRTSRELIGKYLFTRLPLTLPHSTCFDPVTVLTGGMIVETEAYTGVEDRASHAYGHRRTKRTETMYRAGGIAYVYLCYGMHALLNVVTGACDVPHAVLIRAILPTHGIAAMLSRRNRTHVDRTLTSGPGALTQALGIDTSLDGIPLSGNRLWIEDRGVKLSAAAVKTATRIGVEYAGPDAQRPLRFLLAHTPWVSRNP